MDEVVLVSACRTPFGRFGGSLREVPAIELGGLVMRETLRRAGMEPAAVDEVFVGVCSQGEPQDLIGGVVGRQALMKAGLPPQTVSVTLDRACCSSMTAIGFGCRAIYLGEAEIVLAGGTENMSRVPHILRGLRWGHRLGHEIVQDPLFEMGYKEFNPVARDAGEVALEHGIGREAQDAWAYQSQMRWAAASAAGKFADEVVPLEVPAGKGKTVLFTTDECPRPDTTLEKLAGLPTIYGSPTVTAGNAPGLNDGAAFALLTTRRKAQELGLQPLATVVKWAGVADSPRNLATVPAQAIGKVLQQAGLTVDDLKLIEINEAFAAVTCTSARLLADNDPAKERAIHEKLNVNGGAIAIGHPVGASGARITMTMIYELRRQGGGYGAAAICGGLAQGDAIIVRVD